MGGRGLPGHRATCNAHADTHTQRLMYREAHSVACMRALMCSTRHGCAQHCVSCVMHLATMFNHECPMTSKDASALQPGFQRSPP